MLDNRQVTGVSMQSCFEARGEADAVKRPDVRLHP
jgi:hypothetical protein